MRKHPRIMMFTFDTAKPDLELIEQVNRWFWVYWKDENELIDIKYQFHSDDNYDMHTAMIIFLEPF